MGDWAGPGDSGCPLQDDDHSLGSKTEVAWSNPVFEDDGLAPSSSLGLTGSDDNSLVLRLNCNLADVPPCEIKIAQGKTVGELRKCISETLEIEESFTVHVSMDEEEVLTDSDAFVRELNWLSGTTLTISDATKAFPAVVTPPSTPLRSGYESLGGVASDEGDEDTANYLGISPPRVNRSAVTAGLGCDSTSSTVHDSSTGVGTTTGGGGYYSAWNSKSSTGFVGLSNQGATCYLNSLIQSLYMTYELRHAVYQWQYDPAKYEEVESCVPAQLQRLFVQLQTSEERAVETEGLTKSFGWTDSDSFQQQDVQELFALLFDALEVKFKGTPQAGLINAMYQGEYVDYVQCKECGNRAGSGRQKFVDIMLAIREFGETQPISSIEEGIHKYFKSELLDGDNQYMCEKCNKKVDADKGLQLSKVPYVLNIALKRFEYDWERDARCKVRL